MWISSFKMCPVNGWLLRLLRNGNNGTTNVRISPAASNYNLRRFVTSMILVEIPLYLHWKSSSTLADNLVISVHSCQLTSIDSETGLLNIEPGEWCCLFVPRLLSLYSLRRVGITNSPNSKHRKQLFSACVLFAKCSSSSLKTYVKCRNMWWYRASFWVEKLHPTSLPLLYTTYSSKLYCWYANATQNAFHPAFVLIRTNIMHSELSRQKCWAFSYWRTRFPGRIMRMIKSPIVVSRESHLRI